MAKRSYRAGADGSALTIIVAVGAPGSAATNVTRVVDDINFTSLFESNLGDNGSIHRRQLGLSEVLRDTSINIITLVDFINVNQNIWPKNKEEALLRISIQYTLDGDRMGHYF